MDFSQLAAFSNYSLTWIGFGTVLGLIAKIIMPGKEHGGAIATVLMGIAGTLLGCAILQYFSNAGSTIQPVSAEGFAVGAGGAIVFLLFYKVLGGVWLFDSDLPVFSHRRRRRRRFISDLDE
jgi:uncharacterized membrane protein YeaQ/YmgE (transglycosylase-associated protein family)